MGWAWVRSGLYSRFIVAMALLALAPLTFLGVSLVNINERGMQAAVLELHTKLAEKVSEGLQAYVQSIDDGIRFAIYAIQRSKLTWDEKKELLQSLIESHSDIEEIAVVNRSGMELLKVSRKASPVLGDRSADFSFREFIKNQRRTFWMTPGTASAPSLDIYYPLHEALALRVSLVLGSLWKQIAAERVGGTGYALVVNHRGEPILYPPGRLTEKMRGEMSNWPIVRQALTAVSIGSSEYLDSGDVMQVGAYSPVPQLGGAVIIQQPKEEAFLAAIRMKQTAIVLFLIFGAVAVATALWMARQLTQPLLALTRGAREVAKGNFPDDVKLQTGDELQDLAEVFNSMVASLRKYAELQVDRLIEAQQKTEAILFSITDGILMTDDEGRVVHANRRAHELLDIGEGALEGKTLTEALPESKLREAVLWGIHNPEEKIPKEVDMSTDQYRRFLRVAANPVLHPKKGVKIGIVTALRDVTFEKQLDKMKEEFLNSITHDLRNPIGSIIGFTEFLLKGAVGVLNAQQTGMVSGIQKASSRLIAMVNNILDAAKMEATGRVEVKLRLVSMSGIAGHAIDVLGALAQRRGIKVDLAAEEEFSLQADGDLIERVYANLLGNAIKFAAEDGKIVISIKPEGDELLSCVADDGEGIPAQYLNKIFEKFEQVPGQKRGGTGLGLTICRHIVEAHLGKIWVESEPGKGARFYFTTPLDLGYDENNRLVRTGVKAIP